VRLLDHRADIHSQNGEDGVIAEILRRLELDHDVDGGRWCVEFGAWDGSYLSNTFALVDRHAWNAIYIEGDPAKFEDLLTTQARQPRIQAIEAMVGLSKHDEQSLDHLLATTPIPHAYDLLSIDIDSYDLDVWASHTDYRPTIVCIEINSSLPPGVLQWHQPGRPGNSFSSTVAVGRRLGYTLVCHTGNLIFVDDEQVPRLDLPELDLAHPERLFVPDWLPRDHSVVLERLRQVTPLPVKTAVRKVIGRT